MTSILDLIELVGVGEQQLNQKVKMSTANKQHKKCTENCIYKCLCQANPIKLLILWRRSCFFQYFMLQNEHICCLLWTPLDIALSSAKQLSVVPHHPDPQCMHKHKHNKTPTWSKDVGLNFKKMRKNFMAWILIWWWC